MSMPIRKQLHSLNLAALQGVLLSWGNGEPRITRKYLWALGGGGGASTIFWGSRERRLRELIIFFPESRELRPTPRIASPLTYPITRMETTMCKHH